MKIRYQDLFKLVVLVLLHSLFPVLEGTNRRVAWRDDLQSTTYLSLSENKDSFSVTNGYPNFTSVGALTDANGTLGTGTLISSNWVITAAHVLKDSKIAADPVASDWTFTLGLDYQSEDASIYKVDSIFIHPAWEANLPSSPPSEEFYEGDELGVDIALVKLQNPVKGITPAILNLSDSETLGEIVYFAGFGDSGNGVTGANDKENTTRYAASNILDRLVTNVQLTNQPAEYPSLRGGLLAIDFDSPQQNANLLGSAEEQVGLLGEGDSSPAVLSLEGTTASGDSGCAAFHKINGVWSIVGVNSYGTTDSIYGDVAVFTRTANFKEWINSLILVPSALRAAQDLGSNWFFLEWLGYFYSSGSNWVYHMELGWIYLHGSDDSSIWCYSAELGWLWSNSIVYPYLYQSQTQTWLWYLKGSMPAQLYNFSQASWSI